MACPSNEWAKQQMTKLRAERGNKCDICGERLRLRGGRRQINLQFAHMRPTGIKGESRGRRERIRDIRRNPEAYRLLCRDCHIGWDDLHGEPNETEN